MADDDPDDASPWTRDDWVPDSAIPDAAVFDVRSGSSARPPTRPPSAPGESHEPPPEDFDDPDTAGAPTSPSSFGRKVVAGALVAALLVGSAGALLRNDGEADSAPETTEVPTPVDDPAVTTTPSDTLPPTTAPLATVPPSSEPGQSADVADPISPLVVGEVPVWAERTIAVPDALLSMAPTEVITLSQSGAGTGSISVTEFPGGRQRSVDVSEVGAELQLSVDGDTIVVFDSTTLRQIRDGEPVVETELGDGIIFVQPWTGTGNFVVTAPATGPDAPEQDWVLRPDGTIELLDNRFATETSFFSRVFSPYGDALFSGPGGVYAVDPQDNARRISSGTLLAAGSRHWAIEECDETLRCAYSIIEWETGAVTPGVLEPIERFGYLDPSTRLSPDGRSVVYRSDTDGSGQRRILDVATGTSIATGRINQLVYPDSWAADSSGLFYAAGSLQFVDRATGSITDLEDFDFVRTVAARSPGLRGT